MGDPQLPDLQHLCAVTGPIYEIDIIANIYSCVSHQRLKLTTCLQGNMLKLCTLGSPEMQMFMHSILNMAMIPYSQKLPFPLPSEVCCLLKCNYFTFKISGFNLNLSGNSFFGHLYWFFFFFGGILSYSLLHAAKHYISSFYMNYIFLLKEFSASWGHFESKFITMYEGLKLHQAPLGLCSMCAYISTETQYIKTYVKTDVFFFLLAGTCNHYTNTQLLCISPAFFSLLIKQISLLFCWLPCVYYC